MVPIVCPEATVRNYHYSLRNNPEERSCHLIRGRSLKSHNLQLICGTELCAVTLVTVTTELCAVTLVTVTTELCADTCYSYC
jgi:hypothetical protein